MPTPSKPYLLLKNEKKSHRTKAELEQRKKAEKALATGVKLKERDEVKRDPLAHKEFVRLNKLLKNIEKNDAIYEPIINRYCLIQSECSDFEDKREAIYQMMHKLEAKYEEMDEDLDLENSGMYLIEFTKSIAKLSGTMINLDKQIQTKRKMLLDIEKENIMTIAAALRSIPKKVDETENPLLKALKG